MFSLPFSYSPVVRSSSFKNTTFIAGKTVVSVAYPTDEDVLDVVDDGSEHLQKLKGTRSHLYTHHSHNDHAAALFDTFVRNKHVSEDEIRYRLYKCGGTDFYTEVGMNQIYLEKS